MLGLSGTFLYAVCVYLCICVSVFVYLCMRHLVISVLISLDQELSENVWFVWSKPSYSGDKWRCYQGGTTKQRKIVLLSKPESRNHYDRFDVESDGSFVLHLPTFYLVGFRWDDHSRSQYWWDGSQLAPSQSPTNHPSRIFRFH